MAVERARPDPRLLLGTPGIGIGALTMLFVGGGATSHLVVPACWIVVAVALAGLGVARQGRGAHIAAAEREGTLASARASPRLCVQPVALRAGAR